MKLRTDPNRIEKEKEDKEIVEFIRKVQNSDNRHSWEEFDHPLIKSTNPALTGFKIKNLIEKYNFDFLDRIQINLESNDLLYATVIGEYQQQLYIHLDKTGLAEPLANYATHSKISKTDSLETQFNSSLEFQHLYLGRYLLIHNRYEEEKSYKISKLPPSFRMFSVEMNRNEAYLEIVKLQIATLPGKK